MLCVCKTSCNLPSFKCVRPSRQMKRTILMIVALLLALSAVSNPEAAKATPVSSPGRDIRVGTDVKTIREAIKLAQPGDTIHLQPIVYHDTAIFQNKKGEPGRPITLEGHGATLEGSDPLDSAKWKEVSPGLRRSSNRFGRGDRERPESKNTFFSFAHLLTFTRNTLFADCHGFVSVPFSPQVSAGRQDKK